MIENKKFKKITELFKQINPDRDFLLRSTAIITSSEQNLARRFTLPSRLIEGITPKAAFAFASIFLVAIVASISYFAGPGRLASSLNDKTLAQEATQANLQIDIAEAVYFDQSAEKVALALDKIAGTKEPEALNTAANNYE